MVIRHAVYIPSHLSWILVVNKCISSSKQYRLSNVANLKSSGKNLTELYLSLNNYYILQSKDQPVLYF
jgi:hypothetical protein